MRAPASPAVSYDGADGGVESLRGQAWLRAPEARDSRRAQALDEAVNGLVRRAPRWSAARRLHGDQAAVLAGLAVFAAGLAMAAPGATMLAGAVLAAGGFSSLILFRFWAALTARPHAAMPGAVPPEREAEHGPLPVYTILVPLYREARMAPQIVAALGALDYPARLLDVKLVIEADDAETLAAVRACAPAHFEIVETPAGGPRTKPKAMSFALAFARGTLLTIYDAEDRPHPMQLRAAAAAFASGGEDLVCVQAPLRFYNARENFLTRCFALEYAIHFHLALPALLRLGAPIPLGGTSNHFRTKALRQAGGWDPYNVTEDADLGFRLAAAGGRVGMIAPPTCEEATCRLPPWVRQRSRWLKGYAQTLLVHTRAAPGRIGPMKAAALWLTLGGALTAALAHTPALVWLGLVLAGWVETGRLALIWTLALACAGYAAMWAGAWRAARVSGERSLILAALLTPFYWPLHSAAAVMAVWQLVTAPFRWEKTEHGVSRIAPPHMYDAPPIRRNANGAGGCPPAPSIPVPHWKGTVA